MSSRYDYKTVVDRRNTGSYKYNAMYAKNPNVSLDTVPLNTADMEIKSPPEVYEGLSKFIAGEPILGYTQATDEIKQTVVDWMKDRHNYEIEKDWIVNTPGVINAFHVAIEAFSEQDDGVIIFRPVYYPFGNAIRETRRKEVNVPLIEDDGYYTIDFDKFEEEASKPENKILLFCSPHNPVGRVWTREELEKVVEICVRHDLFIICDEIWLDFTAPGKEHIMIGRISEEINDRLVLCTSITKSFNLAGLSISNIIVPDSNVRERYQTFLAERCHNMVNAVGLQAIKIVYTKCHDWLDGVNDVIHSNMLMVKEFFEEKHPEIKAPVSEGTYVQWVDFSALGLSSDELDRFMDIEAEFFTEHGHIYGQEGVGYERINCAVPKEALQKMLNKLDAALNKLKNNG